MHLDYLETYNHQLGKKVDVKISVYIRIVTRFMSMIGFTGFHRISLQTAAIPLFSLGRQSCNFSEPGSWHVFGWGGLRWLTDRNRYRCVCVRKVRCLMHGRQSAVFRFFWSRIVFINFDELNKRRQAIKVPARLLECPEQISTSRLPPHPQKMWDVTSL